MANQSLDMEEILNVRWATEDPNPTEKVAEEKRVKEMGQEAISGMIDEGLIEAAQTLRTLEEGEEEDFYHIEASVPEPELVEEEEIERPVKKAKSGSGRGGLFDEEALDNLKFYADLARKQAEEERERKRKVPLKTGPVGMKSLLGGYGSGDESD